MTEEKYTRRHGGNIYEAAREYGIPPDSILDFSASINPLGVPKAIKDVIASNVNSLSSYPDPECTGLKECISNYLGVCGSRIIVGNGALEVIFLLFEALRPKRVLIPSPTFSEYEAAAARYGTEAVYFELRRKEGFRLNVDALIESLNDGTDAILLCNPNNPTSVLYERNELVSLIKYASRRGINVIIDEAFIELTASGNKSSMVHYVNEYDNLFIIRAFTKVFAVPGLRLGYGIGNAGLIKKMWDSKLPWSVNLFAGDIGSVLKDEDGYLNRTAKWLGEETGSFYTGLCGIEGLEAFAPSSNFILVRIRGTNFTAQRLKHEMLLRGILIRDASSFRFLDSSYFRLAVKDRESNARAVEALGQILQRKD
ncbi:L-threonine O-3-phosphate decarboxylase [Anaerobacterium chartisolvens]|uniref:threonine-phosphate decarboxylase n=2 Tax=Anaerobacterium chartisolvens TaxID=1297424 RepID=A0A369B7Q4_9FIRM|nr:L-threonine O-3-phosphate decarboxylase [Anaerobacterium chartisolvens]